MDDDRPVRVTQVLGRLITGVAQQAILLADQLDGKGYEMTLVRGAAGEGEEPLETAMENQARRREVALRSVTGMRGRAPRPADARALMSMRRMLRELRPDVLHTHASKGGAIGRLAALLSRHRPLVIVHTFHGHVLEGYFSRRDSAFFGLVERGLARFTTRIVAVAPEVKEDLVRLKVAPPERIEVLPIGLDLARFEDAPGAGGGRAEARIALGLPNDGPVVAFVGRLAPVKRADRFLRVAERLSDSVGTMAFLVAGTGELDRELRDSPAARRLGSKLTWAGYREDVETVYRASDVLVSTSDMEGTPIAVIEAQAAALPVVCTDSVGIRSTVTDGVTGLVVAPEDEEGLASAVQRVLDDGRLAARLGRAGRERALREFSVDRLGERWDSLYRRLLDERR